MCGRGGGYICRCRRGVVGVGDIYVGVGVCGRGGGYICRCRRGVVGVGDIYVGVGGVW